VPPYDPPHPQFEQRSPNIWLTSGAVVKSPRVPADRGEIVNSRNWERSGHTPVLLAGQTGASARADLISFLISDWKRRRILGHGAVPWIGFRYCVGIFCGAPCQPTIMIGAGNCSQMIIGNDSSMPMVSRPPRIQAAGFRSRKNFADDAAEP